MAKPDPEKQKRQEAAVESHGKTIPDQESVAYLTPAHVAAMEKAARTMSSLLMVRLLFRSGCRVSEVLALTPADFNTSRRTITIQHLKERVVLKCPACGHRLARNSKFCAGCALQATEVMRKVQEHRTRRVILVDQGTIDLVKAFVQGVQLQRNARLFPFGRDWARKLIARMAREAGIPLVILSMGTTHQVSPHRLRDAHATHFITTMQKAGVGDEAYRLLQEQLGHTQITTTFKYRKLGGEEKRQAYDLVFGDGERNVEEAGGQDG